MSIPYVRIYIQEEGTVGEYVPSVFDWFGGSFFFFKSSIYYMEHVGRPWQHYVKVATHPQHVL